MNKSLLLIVTSALALSACHTTTTNNGAQSEQQAAQGTESGIDKSLMDTSVKAGDDFDKYANGAWEKNAVIPGDKSNISVFSTINDQAEQRTGHSSRRRRPFESAGRRAGAHVARLRRSCSQLQPSLPASHEPPVASDLV